jgi:hypothetical protein
MTDELLEKYDKVGIGGGAGMIYGITVYLSDKTDEEIQKLYKKYVEPIKKVRDG